MSGTIFHNSEEGFHPNLNLFEPLTVETGILGKEYQNFGPSIVISKDAPIEFLINGNSGDYIDLKNTKLRLDVQILRADKTPIQAADEVAFVNFPLHSLFRQVDVALNQQIISASTGVNNGYKAILDVLVNGIHNPSNPKNCTHLQSALFFKDEGIVSANNVVNGGNSGLAERYKFTSSGKKCELVGNLFVDVCQQARYIPFGVDIHFKFYPQNDAFMLMTDGDDSYSFEITNPSLDVCKVKVNPAVIQAHDKALDISPAIFPFTKSDFKIYNIAPNLTSFIVDNLFPDYIPDKIIVCLTTSKGYNGHRHRNPYEFKHFGMNYIAFFVDNKPVPFAPLKPDFENNSYMPSFLSLYENNQNAGLIERDQFERGSCIHVFNLNPIESGGSTNINRKGHNRLHIDFGTALPEAITAIVYSQKSSVFMIDKTKNIFL
jgi:hypothetical protein